MFAHEQRSLRRHRVVSVVCVAVALCMLLLNTRGVRAQTSGLALGGSDACGSAEVISGPGPFLFDNSLASVDGVASEVCNFFEQSQIDRDVWFCWTAPLEECPSGFLIETCGETSVDTKIAVYDGCGTCPPQTPLSCSDDDCGGQFRQTRVLFNATPGQSYAIRVGTFPGAGGGTGNFNITCSAPPLNDECADAEPITGQGLISFDNIGATLDGPLHAECAGGRNPRTDHDVWYCWTAPCTGNVFAETCGLTLVDTKLTVYNGCTCPPDESTFLSCNDDDGVCGTDVLQSRVAFEAVQGRNYLIRVGTFAFAKGGIGEVNIQCGLSQCPAAGDCTDPHATPGCNDQSCCEKVCAVDSFCCSGTGQWDSICARRASGLCGGSYNTCTPTSGTCDALGGNGTPGCNDPVCCNAVCAVDPFCCISDWDAQCVAEAAGICSGSFAECAGGTGSCQGLPGNGTPGCDDPTCCNAICANDPLCCVVEWDEVCALREGSDCQLACGVGAGDCFTGGGGAGCDDTDCCSTVCDVDPFCCASEWDSLCADRASLLCAADCPLGDVTWVDPPDGVVYAGYPLAPATQTPLGPREFEVLAPPGASAGCFSLCETNQIGDPNAIQSVTTEIISGGFQTYRITLQRPITPGAVTTLTYVDNDLVEHQGTFIAHPANVDADAVASPLDILEMVDCCLNGICSPAWGAYSCDVDQSGGIHPPDLIALIDLLNGAGPLDSWNGTALPALGEPCN